MTKLGCSGYCLSHQMLFFLSARMVSASVGPWEEKETSKMTHGSVGSWTCASDIRKQCE